MTTVNAVCSLLIAYPRRPCCCVLSLSPCRSTAAATRRACKPHVLAAHQHSKPSASPTAPPSLLMPALPGCVLRCALQVLPARLPDDGRGAAVDGAPDHLLVLVAGLHGRRRDGEALAADPGRGLQRAYAARSLAKRRKHVLADVALFLCCRLTVPS